MSSASDMGNAIKKRTKKFVNNTDLAQMAKDLNITEAQITEAITNPGDCRKIQQIWQQNAPLAERCGEILELISPLTEEKWDSNQTNGVATLARAIYLNPGTLKTISQQRSGRNYLQHFLREPVADIEQFNSELAKQREIFRKRFK